MTQSEVIEALTELGLATSYDIAEHLKSPRSTVTSAVRKLLRDHKIAYVLGAANTTQPPRIYYII